MRVLSIVLVVLSALLLGAHFLRAGHLALMVVSLASPALLFLRRPWAPWILRVLLALGAIEWLRTMYVSASLRRALGQPSGRMIVILSAVAFFTAVSAALVTPRREPVGQSDRQGA